MNLVFKNVAGINTNFDKIYKLLPHFSRNIFYVVIHAAVQYFKYEIMVPKQFLQKKCYF